MLEIEKIATYYNEIRSYIHIHIHTTKQSLTSGENNEAFFHGMLHRRRPFRRPFSSDLATQVVPWKVAGKTGTVVIPTLSDTKYVPTTFELAKTSSTKTKLLKEYITLLFDARTAVI